MNQKICPNCRNSNSPDKSFCTNCGQMLPAAGQPNDLPPTIFGGSPNAPGFTPNQPNFSQQAPPPPFNQAAAPAKKSNKGLWLAIIGILGFFGLLIVGVGLLGAFVYFKSAKKSNIDINLNNTNTYQTNTSRDPFPTNSSNTSSPTSTSMSETDKYRIFYAASKVNDQALTLKISKRIGIIDDSNKPTPYYKTFITGMFSWAAKDVDFVKRVDTKDKAMDYIRSQTPDLVSSVNPSSNPVPNNVSLGVLNGKASNLVQPEYPPAAKAVRASGLVNVQVNVDESGNVTEATAVSGHPMLKQAAEQAARASKFNPTILSGKAVKVSGIIAYNFTA